MQTYVNILIFSYEAWDLDGSNQICVTSFLIHETKDTLILGPPIITEIEDDLIRIIKERKFDLSF